MSERREWARERARQLSQHIAIVCCGVVTVEMGRSQRWLADAAGIAAPSLRRTKAGHGALSLETAIALCVAAGLPLSEVVAAHEAGSP